MTMKRRSSEIFGVEREFFS